MKVCGFAVPLARKDALRGRTICVSADGVWCRTEQATTGHYNNGDAAWLWVDVGLPDSYTTAQVYDLPSQIVTLANLAISGTEVNTTSSTIDVSDFVPYVIETDDTRTNGTSSYTTEEQSPLRVVIRADVTYGTLCKSVIWYHFSRDSDVVHVQHRWISHQSSIELKEIGIEGPAGSALLIRDQTRYTPATVDGVAAKLWTGGTLDYKLDTMIDDGEFSADWLTHQEETYDITEATLRAHEPDPIGVARTHWIAFDTSGGTPTWAEIDPLRLPASLWTTKQPAVPKMMVDGDETILDAMCDAWVTELDGPIDASINEMALGWYYFGYPQFIRYNRDSSLGAGTRSPDLYRPTRRNPYYDKKHGLMSYMRGTSGIYDLMRQRMHASLDMSIEDGGGTYNGYLLHGDRSDLPAYWSSWQGAGQASLRLRSQNENDDWLSDLELWWYVSHDRSALRLLAAAKTAHLAKLADDESSLPDPYTAQDVIDTFATHMGHNNRLLTMASLACLLRVYDDSEIERYLNMFWTAIYDTSGLAHLNASFWGDTASTNIQYKLNVKLINMIELAEALDSQDIRDAVVAGAKVTFGSDYTYDSTYQPTQGVIIATAHRWASLNSDRDQLRSAANNVKGVFGDWANNYGNATQGAARWTAGGNYSREGDNTELDKGFPPQASGGWCYAAPMLWGMW